MDNYCSSLTCNLRATGIFSVFVVLIRERQCGITPRNMQNVKSCGSTSPGEAVVNIKRLTDNVMQSVTDGGKRNLTNDGLHSLTDSINPQCTGMHSLCCMLW